MTYRIELGKRIKTARRRAGIRQLDVAEKLDVGQATVSGWENGAYAPDDDVLHQLAELFHVDAEDLIGTQPPAGSTDDFSNTVMIPEYPLQVAAGGGALIEESAPTSYWPWPKRFFQTMDWNPAWFMVLTVTGASMEPTLRSGDKLLVDSTRNNPAVPGLYVLGLEDMAVVKRIELIPGSNPARLRISSDNQLHHAYETDASTVKIIGWVAAKVSRL